jgi:hypothetical protein
MLGATLLSTLQWITFLGTRKHTLVRFVHDEAPFFIVNVFFHTDPQLQVWTSGPYGANNTFPKNSFVRLFVFRPLYTSLT